MNNSVIQVSINSHRIGCFDIKGLVEHSFVGTSRCEQASANTSGAFVVKKSRGLASI